MANVWTVTQQELRSTLRDRRTLMSTVLVPLLMIPLFTVGLPLLLGTLFGGQAQTRQTVGVVGELPPALKSQLEQDSKSGKGVRLLPVGDPTAAVQQGDVDAALKVQTRLPSEAGNSGTLQLFYKVGNLKAESGAADKVKSAVSAYNDALVGRKLAQLGLTPTLLTPVKLSVVNASNAAEASSGALAFIIPLFLLQFILAGATAAATDSTAGERERGTFEALLATPTPRHTLLLGKLLATTLTALTAAAFSVLGLSLSAPIALLVTPAGQSAAQSATQQAFGGSLVLGAGGLLAVLLTATTAALVISALLLTLSLFARSVREAQTYIAPLTLLIVLPATLLQFADFLRASDALYAAPLVGSMLVVLDTVKGALSWPHLLLSLGGNVLMAALLTLLATRLFGREGVAFKK
ncbi:ABC transporter permease [Deinococcus irradiatisoli]|uniref:ABC transporter permease n=1 Tax=Deinococcus irradiatisoli TaxID=2202254 RepID=A0A2Z3JCZ8_9DEIO|nr:ABC transporter permease subunit [Deinococcus irradiatisoli]AWN22912.1 ABC transporter permease [Deinococcus irradiatisoli]